MASALTIWGTFCNVQPQYGLYFHCAGANSLCSTIFSNFDPVVCDTSVTPIFCTNNLHCNGANYTDNFHFDFHSYNNSATVSDTIHIHNEVYKSSYQLELGKTARSSSTKPRNVQQVLAEAPSGSRKVLQDYQVSFRSSNTGNSAKDLTRSITKYVRGSLDDSLSDYYVNFLEASRAISDPLYHKIRGSDYMSAVTDTLQNMDTLLLDGLSNYQSVGNDSTWIISLLASHLASGSAIDRLIALTENSEAHSSTMVDDIQYNSKLVSRNLVKSPTRKQRRGTSTKSTSTCTPSLVLVGASTSEFNAKGKPFSAQLSCGSFNTSQVVAVVDFKDVVTNLNITQNRIDFGGFTQDRLFLTVWALTTDGLGAIGAFDLSFGDIKMPIRVLAPNNVPLGGVNIVLSSSAYAGKSQKQITLDSDGTAIFSNLPPTSVSVKAKTDNNQLAVGGFFASSSLVTIKLVPFGSSGQSSKFSISSGKTGRTGSDTTRIEKRNQTLTVSTNNLPDLQRASATYPVTNSTKRVSLRYYFQTDEVPGGYFGTQYNDYFSVSIRADTGQSVFVTNSMNELGLGAFDSSGATGWYTLNLDIPPGCKSVQFEIAVSNVGDSAYQSKVVADGGAGCECGQDCTQCADAPMCQDACKNPPYKSCAFYRNCVEATKPCAGDPSSYAIDYGEYYCLAFTSRISYFTAQGQDWVYNTMHCLQTSLIPAVKCDNTCANIQSFAFNSHPSCYVNNGFCTLSCWDYIQVIATVAGGLLNQNGFSQAMQTSIMCLEDILEALNTEGSCVSDLAPPVVKVIANVASAVYHFFF